MGIDNKTYAAAKTYANKVALGFQSVTQTATGFKITFKDGSTATYNVQNMHEHANKSILDLLSVDLNGNLLYDGKSISPSFIDTAGDGSKFLANDGTYKTVTTGGVAYDDTQVKADIQTNTDDITAIKTKLGNTTMGTTATDVTGAVAEINGNQLDTVSFSADYKNIVLNRKNGLNPYSIPIAAIINHAKLIELADVNTTDIGNGKTLVYDTATQKHKYVSYSGTDELVKMDSTTNAHYLADLIDKQTIVNDNGTLKVKKLDGQQVTIAEINYLKGLTMNVMDLVNSFANGGVKVLNTPVATHADLATLDRSKFIDGISYIVYVLADETHAGVKTTYLCNKTSETYFGNADNQRNFTTDPIDLANEVTGKLGTSNIDVDSLWKLLTINDTYKTLTVTDNVFGTHGAKAMYDELTAAIGNKANQTDFDTHKDDTTIHITQAEKDSYTKKTDIIDNLTSTDTDKPASANQVKILDDKKLNKADANKINLTNLENVNLKEYILENCTEEKIYYFIARSNCTDTPKSNSHFYVTVEKVGSFTYKIEAKELSTNNYCYVCTYRSDSAMWTDWEKMLSSGDITTTINSTSTDDKVPSAKVMNEMLGSKYGKQSTNKLNEYTTILDWAKNNVGNSVGYTGQKTFVDTPLGDTYGTLVCLGNAVTTGLLVIAYSNFNEPVYIRKIKGTAVSNADWIMDWQRLCTTTIADTNGTGTISNGATGSVTYKVKNGVAYVSVRNLANGLTGNLVCNITGLPKADGYVNIGIGKIGVRVGTIYTDDGTTFYVHKTSTDEGFCSFSYPVAEE